MNVYQVTSNGRGAWVFSCTEHHVHVSRDTRAAVEVQARLHAAVSHSGHAPIVAVER